MPRLGRLIRWAVFLGFLSAVGVGVFHVVRYRPRFVIPGPLVVHNLSPDGSVMVAAYWNGGFHGRPCGPVQVWDLKNGRILHDMPTDIWIMALSPDGNHAAVLPGDETLRLLDCKTGKRSSLNIGWVPGELQFSPDGHWLVIPTGESYHFIDTHQHQFVSTPKGHFLCFNKAGHAVFVKRELERETFVVDLNTGAKIAEAVLGSCYWLASPDGSLLATWRGDGKQAGDCPRTEVNGGIEIWDLTTLKQRFHWDVPEAFVHVSAQGFFSQDARMFGYRQIEKDRIVLRFFEAFQGCELGITQVDATDAEVMEIKAFVPDGSLWGCLYEEDRKGQMVVIQAESGRVAWKGSRATGFALPIIGDGTVFWHDVHDENLGLCLLDVWTGAKRAKEQHRMTVVQEVTPDGRHILATALNAQLRDREPYFWVVWLEEKWPEFFRRSLDTTLVMESRTGNELFRVVAGTWSAKLSADCSTLLTVDSLDQDGSTFHIKVWDVHATRAWFWSLTVAAATGLALLAVRWSLRKLRRKKHPFSPVQVGLPNR